MSSDSKSMGFPLFGREKKLSDMDATIIQDDPPMPRKPRRRKGIEESDVTERTGRGPNTTVDDIASAFMQEMGISLDGEIDNETRADDGTFLGHVHRPAVAGFLSIILWGGGFLYIRRFTWAVATLLTLVVSGTLYAALSGLLPATISRQLLEGLRWTFSLAPSLSVAAGVVVVIWWFSLVIPTEVSLRYIPIGLGPTRTSWKIICTAPVPVVAELVQGRYWRSYITWLCWLFFGFGSFSAYVLWNHLSLLTPAEVVGVELYLLAFSGAALLGACGILLGWMSSAVRALREIDFFSEHEDYVQTEYKFVTLGIVLLMVAAFFTFRGAPGQRAQQEIQKFSTQVSKKGLTRSAKYLRRGAVEWRRQADRANDLLSMLK